MCPRAKAIWRYFASVNLGRKGSNADFLSWFLLNLADNEKDVSWPTSFLIKLWYLWKWRSGVCFDREALLPHDKIGFLRAKCKEIVQALCKELREGRDGGPGRQEILICWDAPPADWMVLNTDGTSKGNRGKAGGGGLIRGDKGEWVCVLESRWVRAQL